METAIILPNDGYLRGCLPRDLFKSLVDEALASRNHRERETGVVDVNGDQTCPHYDVSDEMSQKLMHVLSPKFDEYNREFGYYKSVKVHNSPSPIIFAQPWYNLQSPNDFLPSHGHGGILSYTVWLKLPKLSEFIFYYNSAAGGGILQHHLKLTPAHAGEYIIFPSRLQHAVLPFKSDDPDEIRISLSGNIFFQGVEDYKSRLNKFT